MDKKSLSIVALTSCAIVACTLLICLAPPNTADVSSDVSSDYYNPDKYLNFTFSEDGSICIIMKGEYALDCRYSMDPSADEKDWKKLTDNAVSVEKGQTVYVRGSNSTFSRGSLAHTKFNFGFADGVDGKVYASGSVMSLIDNGTGTKTKVPDYCFFRLFENCSSLVTAPALPATSLGTSCYEFMFYACTSLVNAPALPATSLASSCYVNMFYSCRSLVNAPALPAVNLASSCYMNMFNSCRSLVTAPALPAVNLASSCYRGMFSGCTSLTSAPALPAVNLASSCYSKMFSGCTSLISAPALPATRLESSCYESMFFKCSNLVNAPALPATRLESSCYERMFYDCFSISSIFCDGEYKDGSAKEWLHRVSSNGVLYTHNYRSWDASGTVPDGWKITTSYTMVVFVPKGGTVEFTFELCTLHVPEKWKLDKLPNVVYTGHTFLGWFTAEGEEVTLDTEFPSSSTTTIYAKWKTILYTVKFYSDGVEAANPIGVNYYSKYGTLPELTKNGYTFLGWFTAETGGEKIVSNTFVNIPSDHNLYAHWTPNVENVVLNPNYEGGTAGAATAYYDSLSFKKIDILTRTGYTLLGYFDGDIKVVNADGTFAEKNVPGWIEGGKWKKDGKGITLTAHWEVNNEVVKLESGYQGGTDGKAEITFDTGSFTKIDLLTRVGYTLTGYYDGNTMVVDSDGKFASSDIPGWIEGGKWKKDGKDITLTAKWKANEYVVTFDAKGGVPETQTETETFDSNYILPSEPTKTGYAFLGWFTAETGGTEVTSGTKVNITAPQTLYAHWEANDETVKLKSGYQGGTDGEAEIKFDSESFTKVDILTRTGYTLLGYFDGETKVIDADGTFASSDVPGWIEGGKWKKDGKDITLTARWKANEYAVTFDANGGVPESQTETETFDSNYILPSEPTKTGHTFLGWFTAKTGGTEVTSGTKVNITAPQTLYAHWKINQYTIIFDTDGGSYVEPITQDYGTDVVAPENPTKKGHTFSKWNRDIPATMPAENITIKASWILNKVEITFLPNILGKGDEYQQSIEYGVGDMKLYACRFDPEEPGKNYYFGWNTKSGGTGEWFMDEQSMEEYLETNTGTLILYAQWSIETKSDKGAIAPGDPISFTLTASYDDVGEVWVSGDELEEGSDYEAKVLQSNGEIQVTLLPNYTKNLTNGRYIIGIYFETESVGYCGFDVFSPTPRTVFSVVYYSNGGSAPAPEAYNANLGETITVATYSGTKEGYAFGGWLYNGVKIVKPGEKIEVKEPITLTAVWIFVPAGPHIVTFDADGGSNPPSAITVEEGCTFTVPEYKGTKDGYTFKGWSCDGKTYKAGDTVRMEKSDITMKAAWEKNPEPAPENNTGMIVGIVVGVITAVALIGGALYFVKKK